MSIESSSRSSIATFADLIETIDQRADLPLRRPQDLASALRRFCRHQQRNAAEVSAGPVKVRRGLAEMLPRGSGVTAASLRNLESPVGKALLMTGINAVPRRFDDAVMRRYRQELLSKSLMKRPKQAGRDAVLSWNIARGHTTDARLTELTVSDSRPCYRLSFDAFAPSFRADERDDPFSQSLVHRASPDAIAARCKRIRESRSQSRSGRRRFPEYRHGHRVPPHPLSGLAIEAIVPHWRDRDLLKNGPGEA